MSLLLFSRPRAETLILTYVCLSDTDLPWRRVHTVELAHPVPHRRSTQIRLVSVVQTGVGNVRRRNLSTVSVITGKVAQTDLYYICRVSFWKRQFYRQASTDSWIAST